MIMEKININKTNSGFTLIELMVTITIIALLSAVLFASFDQARMQARDKARMTALKELELAIEMYKAQYGRYPAQGCGGSTTWTGPGPHSQSWGNDNHCDVYIVGLVPDFISALPFDPKFEMLDNRGYLYRTDATGSAFKVLAHDTVETLFAELGGPFARCAGNCGLNSCTVNNQPTVYAVYSVGAACW